MMKVIQLNFLHLHTYSYGRRHMDLNLDHYLQSSACHQGSHKYQELHLELKNKIVIMNIINNIILYIMETMFDIKTAVYKIQK